MKRVQQTSIVIGNKISFKYAQLRLRNALKSYVIENKYIKFVQIHKSYVVNLRHIQKIERHEVYLVNGIHLPIGEFFQNNLNMQIKRMVNQE